MSEAGPAVESIAFAPSKPVAKATKLATTKLPAAKLSTTKLATTKLAAAKLSIPLLVGGGIGTGAHLIAALALGADGVVVGTRFLVAEEIWAHADYKQRLIEADETETTLILSSLRNTARVLRNEATAAVQALESEGAGIDLLMPHIAGKAGREAYRTGDWTKAALSVGQSVAFADKIEPLAAIIARFEAEARAALARLEGLRGQS